MPSEVGKQLGDDVDNKDNDNEYCKEPSIRTSHNERQQGVYVDKAHDKQLFVQSTEEGSQEREGTSTRQREAKAYPHQEELAIVKSKVSLLSKHTTITSQFYLPLFVIAPAGFWPRRSKERENSNNDDDDDDNIYMS